MRRRTYDLVLFYNRRLQLVDVFEELVLHLLVLAVHVVADVEELLLLRLELLVQAQIFLPQLSLHGFGAVSPHLLVNDPHLQALRLEVEHGDFGSVVLSSVVLPLLGFRHLNILIFPKGQLHNSRGEENRSREARCQRKM